MFASLKSKVLLTQNVCLYEILVKLLGQKLGHQAKSKENLVNTLKDTFLKVIMMNLAQNVFLDAL